MPYYTIGYEGVKLDGFILLLEATSVRCWQMFGKSLIPATRVFATRTAGRRKLPRDSISAFSATGVSS